MAEEPYRDRPGCEVCGTAIDLDAAPYDDQGRRVCAGCQERSAQANNTEQIRRATRGAAYTALGLAVTSFACGGLLFAGGAIVMAVGALGAARTAQLSGEGAAASGVGIPATIAIVIGSLRVLAMLAVFAG
jgi:hypothetical protein